MTSTETPASAPPRRRRRLGALPLILVCVLLGAAAGIAHNEASSTVLSQGQWSDNFGFEPVSSLHTVFDYVAAFDNTSTSAVTLRSITFAGGLPAGIHILHTDVVSSKSYSGLAAEPTIGWPPQRCCFIAPRSTLRRLAGYRLPPKAAAEVVIPMRITIAGCYVLDNPTVTADRSGFWGSVPFVGPHQSLTLTWTTRICAGHDVSDVGSNNIDNLFSSGFHGDSMNGQPVRVERVTETLRPTAAGDVRSGEYTDELADGSTAHSWFTALNGTGSFRSGPMDLAPGWEIAVTGGSCQAPNQGPRSRIWVQRPNGTDRHTIVGAGGLGPDSGGSETGDTPASGPVQLVVSSKCSWQVEIQTKGGPIGM